ncbi:MAG: SDR family oxidoreductase [Reichenbachiella sp.]|uniref:SDR family oxidoreductase n=1 Tax=Reichenbachiella sp. TaxID=2184521 RepID=UPI0032986820
MKNILVAGASGYLGTYIVKGLQAKNKSIQAMARNRQKLLDLNLSPEQMVVAEVTKPETLRGKLDGIDVVISTVGITRQKDNLSYMDVDFQANMNLLLEAKRSGVKKFIYISAIHGDKMRHLKIMEAKERFVDALKQSGMEYVIVRPNGFFSDMKDFLDMAKRGRVYLFGHGNFQLNPIHGSDLAEVVIDAIKSKKKEINVGGPDILTQNEIAELALQAWMRPPKISHVPDWVRRALLWFLRKFTSSKTYGPFEFFLTLMAQDNVAPRYGVQRLQSFFNLEVDRLIQEKS